MNNDNKIRPINYVAGVDEFLEQLNALVDEDTSHETCDLLAAYLRCKMREKGWQSKQLAEKLDCPHEYLRLILDAEMPASKIDRYFLESIADLFQEESATLFSLVSRTFYSEDNRDDMIQAKQQLSEYILSEVNTVLFATIDEKFADDANKEVYDQVIGELQRIIARQRRDLRFIEGLLKSLENPNLTQVLNQNLAQISSTPDEQTIIYLKKNLERIVKHFGGAYSEHIS